ncbi:NADH:flavin oxidoreductase/NADH oxidase [Erythrobacter sp. GH1-10]|uniref:NADH:flavin oxidoreductase/NADH oxidase n=1 Tax=Erythrobacter sp. GH1-10 TaxID=3349334 RepID=UPI003877C3AA
MAKLFETLDLGQCRLQNRIVVSPMCQYSAPQGEAGDWHIMHIGQFAVANPGLIMLEGTAVSPTGRISLGDLCLFNDAQEKALERVCRFVREHSGSKIGIQLFHSGRKGSQYRPWDKGTEFDAGATLDEENGGWTLKGPSAIRYSADYTVPHALTWDEMEEIKSEFVASAIRAERLGIDVIELHYAHGYLLHSFLSEESNQRGDAYGGSLENRMRFPLEVFAAVREAVNCTVGARISGSDFSPAPQSWTIEDAVSFGRALCELGCEFLDVSGGFLSPTQDFASVYGPGYQVDLSARIRSEIGLPTIAVGVLTDPVQAERIVSTGEADAIAIARGMLYDPRWPWKAAYKLQAEPTFPPQYERAFALGYPEMFNASSPLSALDQIVPL